MPLSLTVFYLLIDNPAVHQSEAEVGDDSGFALRGIFDLPLEFPLVPRTRFDEPSAAQVSPAAQQSLLIARQNCEGDRRCSLERKESATLRSVAGEAAK